MPTTLKKFEEAYATLTYAIYEPLILNWVSGFTLRVESNLLANRFKIDSVKESKESKTTAASMKLAKTVRGLKKNMFRKEVTDRISKLKINSPISASNFDNEDIHHSLDRKNFEEIILSKISSERPKTENSSNYTSMISNPWMGSSGFGFNDELMKFRQEVYDELKKVVEEASEMSRSISEAIRNKLEEIKREKGIFDFFPHGTTEKALSPIGIAHFYRQLYFNYDEGFGPIEHCFAIAPLETLEIVISNVRKQIHEERLEMGHESVSENATEERNMEEVSDKVTSMLQRDMSASMSISGSYSTPVWQVGASVSASMSMSSQKAKEVGTKRIKDVTKRASERITSTYALTTREYEETEETNLTKRILRNKYPYPVNYALRRIYRRVRVKIQDIGPRAIWQLYLRTPGKNLAKSKFVHFREAQEISPPEVLPGVPPRPIGDVDVGTTTSEIWYTATKGMYVTLKIVVPPDRRVTAVSIDSITDLAEGDKDDIAPAPRNDAQWVTRNDGSNYEVDIGVVFGNSGSVSISYTYSWEPADHIIAEWEDKRKGAQDAFLEEAYQEAFEREKELIIERSKIKSRPSNELRREERYEVMNRMISHLFASGTQEPTEPSPLEIESFHRFFDIESMFLYTHPSWWKPRFHQKGLLNGRKPYEITAESDHAPLGSSLGWRIQLDGDNRRNEFLNSPWVRICLPIMPGLEEDAVHWLAEHVEDKIGFDDTNGPLKTLLEELRKRRGDEASLEHNGYDYVTVDSSVGAPDGALSPENLYPIVDEFDVTVPTEGFIYDQLYTEDQLKASEDEVNSLESDSEDDSSIIEIKESTILNKEGGNKEK